MEILNYHESGGHSAHGGFRNIDRDARKHGKTPFYHTKRPYLHVSCHMGEGGCGEICGACGENHPSALLNINKPKKKIRKPMDIIYSKGKVMLQNLLEELTSIPGIDVDIALHWLPAGTNKKATRMAQECEIVLKQHIFHVRKGKRPLSEMPRNIFILPKKLE